MKRQAVNTQQPINRAHPLARGLRGWWLTLPQWYGGSKWYDLCGLNPGTLTNMTAGFGWQPSARSGGFGALNCDGTDDYVNAASSFASNGNTEFSFSVWVRPTSFAAQRGVLTWGDSAGKPATLLHINAAATFRVYVPNAYTTSSATLTVNTWNHIAATVAAGATGAVTLYLNGKSTGTGARTESTVDTTQWRMGFGKFASSTYLLGQLDDVTLYNRALSAAEVFALYNESRLGYPGLLNRWEWPLAGEEAAAATVPYRMLLGVGV